MSSLLYFSSVRADVKKVTDFSYTLIRWTHDFYITFFICDKTIGDAIIKSHMASIKVDWQPSYSPLDKPWVGSSAIP